MLTLQLLPMLSAYAGLAQSCTGACGWSATRPGMLNCGAAPQGTPSPQAKSSCDGFQNICYGAMALADCQHLCEMDASCDSVVWKSTTLECFPKVIATACSDYAAKPEGCPPSAAAPPTAPISAWSQYVRCPCATKLASPLPAGGGIVCGGGDIGWAITGVLLGAMALYLGGGVALNAGLLGAGRKREGQLHPHVLRWRALLGLARDGVAYARARVQGAEPDYEAMAAEATGALTLGQKHRSAIVVTAHAEEDEGVAEAPNFASGDI